MNNVYRVFLVLLVVGVGIFAHAVPARADLMITPTRVLFQDRDRFKEVTLVNNGEKPQVYEISWVFFQMQEEGTPYKSVASSVTDFDLSKYMVFTPRRITLAPGASQKIRLALRRPEKVPEGDFRAHLKFAVVPDPVDDSKHVGGKPAAVVKINVGYTIPVIFRSGRPDVTADIGQIDIERDAKTGRLKVRVPITRDGGPYSILGDLFLYHEGPNGEEQVGRVSNANLFPEIGRRVFDVPLVKEIAGGSLRVVLKRDITEKDGGGVYAEKTFPLQ